MANKWNTTDIEKISTAFTKKTIETCFQDDIKISGDEIVTFTEYPQINYFVLREIFNRWEESTIRFKSPYFDFDAADVQKSFADFKNTLSRNILVDKENFTELLSIATSKTLNLYLQPEAFFVSDFRDLPDFKMSQDWLSKNTVFFKDYGWVLEGLKGSLDSSSSWIYANQAIDEVKSLLAGKHEDFESVIDAIAEEAGIVKEVPVPEVLVEEKKAPENDNLSFFERLVANPPKPTSTFVEPEVSPFERIVNTIPRVREEVITPEAVKVVEVASVEVPVVAVPVVERVIETVTTTQSVVETRKSIFADLDIPTLNDKLSSSEGNSLSDSYQKSRIESLKGSMTLNQRFGFLNTLFAGDLNAFEGALAEVETYSSFQQAKDMLVSKYAQKYNWNLQNEDSEEFIGLLKRRFS